MFKSLKKSQGNRSPAPDKKTASPADPEQMMAKMQQTMGNKATLKFLDTLKRRAPETVSNFADLAMTGERFKGLRERPKGRDRERSYESYGAGGANTAYSLTEKQGRGSAQTERKFYHKEVPYDVAVAENKWGTSRDYTEDDFEQDKRRAKKKAHKEEYMPLIAAGLGIHQLPLSARVDSDKSSRVGENDDRDNMHRKTKGTMNEMIKGGQDLMKVYQEDPGRFNEIDPEQLQKLMTFDLLFENNDAHFRQYILSEDNQLFKVDNEEYMSENPSAKAGSFLAGLPLANRQMTEGSLHMIRNWDAKYLKEMMQNAAFHSGSGEDRKRQGLFDKEQINRVVSNLHDLKLLAEESEISGLSAREVFDLYNSRDNDDRMTGEMPKLNPDMRRARYNNHMGTRLPIQNPTLFEDLDQDEAHEASKLAESRGGNPVDLTGFKSRLEHRYELPDISSRYRERRNAMRQANTPSTQEGRYMQYLEERLFPRQPDFLTELSDYWDIDK
jgi:hypothetical protein